jgi:hypothetical protein
MVFSPSEWCLTEPVHCEQAVQGCQMVYQTSQFGYIFENLGLKSVGCFMAIWNISRLFGIFYDPLVHFVVIWYILFTSGSPD